MGKTLANSPERSVIRKHPHERGEDFTNPSILFPIAETPPRAWGRRYPFRLRPKIGGNTPTSVGKTYLTKTRMFMIGKHPHERGEDRIVCLPNGETWETPPRAWGRHLLATPQNPKQGNTPTSVGKTPSGWYTFLGGWKHPHERGEDDPDNRPTVR